MTALAALVLLMAAPETDLDAFLEEFTEKRGEVRTLEASYRQTTHTPDEALDTEGTVVYVRPRRLVYREAGDASVFLVDDTRFYDYVQEIRELKIYDIEDSPEAAALFLGFDDDVGRLREAYHLTYIETHDDEKVRRGLEIQPKDREDDALFEKAIVYFREPDLVPDAIHIINDAESRVVTTLHDIRVNADFDPVRSQMDVPEGTTIVDNGAFAEKVGPGGKRLPPAVSAVVESPAQ